MGKYFKLKLRIIERFGTQADFAQAVGAHESLVSRIICGRRVLNEKDQKKWASILKCKPEELFE